MELNACLLIIQTLTPDDLNKSLIIQQIQGFYFDDAFDDNDTEKYNQ